MTGEDLAAALAHTINTAMAHALWQRHMAVADTVATIKARRGWRS